MADFKENIVKGKKYRVCTDADNNTWDRVSMWTSASDVEFENGKSAEELIGNIAGNVPIYDEDISVENPVPRDADTLGGQYSASDITTINNNLRNLTTWELIVDSGEQTISSQAYYILNTTLNDIKQYEEIIIQANIYGADCFNSQTYALTNIFDTDVNHNKIWLTNPFSSTNHHINSHVINFNANDDVRWYFTKVGWGDATKCNCKIYGRNKTN